MKRAMRSVSVALAVVAGQAPQTNQSSPAPQSQTPQTQTPAQTPTPAPSQTPAAQTGEPVQGPTFRTGIKLIDIDVYVTDKDGHFVKDLTKDELEIVEDGRVQPIETLAFVDLPMTLPAPSPTPRSTTS